MGVEQRDGALHDALAEPDPQSSIRMRYAQQYDIQTASDIREIEAKLSVLRA